MCISDKHWSSRYLSHPSLSSSTSWMLTNWSLMHFFCMIDMQKIFLQIDRKWTTLRENIILPADYGVLSLTKKPKYSKNVLLLIYFFCSMGKWLTPESLLLLVNTCELSVSLSKKKKKKNQPLSWEECKRILWFAL